MGAFMVETIDSALRDNNTLGDPGSGDYKVKKGPLRTVLKRIEASAGIGAIAVATKAELDAITDKADNAPGFVVGDSTASNNGQYSWDDSGSAWVKVRDLPDTLTVLENIGGTANAITADTATGVDPAAVQAIVLTAPPGTNTGAVTITLNGGSAKSIKAASGSDPAPGDIVEDVATIFFKVGSEWRQIFTSNPNATFDHQGDYDNGTTYTLDQVVTGSDDAWYQLKVASATGDDPVSGGSGDWLKILDGTALPDNSVTNAKLTAAHSLALSHTVADRTAYRALDKSRYTSVFIQGESGGKFNWDGSDLSANLLGSAINSSAVDSTLDIFTSTNHGIVSGEAFVATTAVNGLSLNTLYYAIGLRTIDYDAESSPFAVGETLTGGTSGATGEIVKVTDSGTTGTLLLKNVVGEFEDNETITDSATGSATANGVDSRDTDNIQIATSFANAMAGTAVSLTGTTATTLKKHKDPMQGIYVTPNADISGASGAGVRDDREWSEGPLSVKMFGASGDTTDDSEAVMGALAFTTQLHFPKVKSPNYYYLASDMVLSAVDFEREDVTLLGDTKGTNGEWTSAVKFGSDAGLKIIGATSDYVLNKLVTRDLFFGPVDSTSRSTPIFDATGLLYWERYNCHFQGDTLKEQPVIRLRWSVGLTSRNCNIWSGLISEDFGTSGDPMNQVDCISDSHNGSRYAGQYAATTFKKVGGLVQSCGDGFDVSYTKAESSSSVVIKGVYFENNKFHDGANFIGRDIKVADGGYARGLDISNNYHAQLTADNPFTTGSVGMSDIPPVLIKKVIGGGIRDNFWTNGGNSEFVEIEHFNSAGTRFPRHIEIINNLDLFTNGTASATWASGVIESQKLALFANDSIVIRDAVEKEIGKTKKVWSPEFRISATGTVAAGIMDTSHFGEIKSIKLLCSDSFDLAATLDIGVLASPTFYVNGFSVGAKSAYTSTAVTLNNTKITAGGGPIIAVLTVTTNTAPGAFRLEVEYVDILE